MLSSLTARRPSRKRSVQAVQAVQAVQVQAGPGLRRHRQHRDGRLPRRKLPGWLQEIVGKAECEEPTEVDVDTLSTKSDIGRCQFFHKAAYGEPIVPRLRICTPD